MDGPNMDLMEYLHTLHPITNLPPDPTHLDIDPSILDMPAPTIREPSLERVSPPKRKISQLRVNPPSPEGSMVMNPKARLGALTRGVVSARQRDCATGVYPQQGGSQCQDQFAGAPPVNYGIGPFDAYDLAAGPVSYDNGNYQQLSAAALHQHEIGCDHQATSHYNALGPIGQFTNPFAQQRIPPIPPSHVSDEYAPSEGGFTGDGFSDFGGPDDTILPEHNPWPDLHEEGTVPSYEAFRRLVTAYVKNIDSKKRAKSLLSQAMYDTILHVHHNPGDTTIKTAQFRFWARKSFDLIRFGDDQILCHHDKPVAVREQIYEVLVHCHQMAGHGGRDKTSHEVRRFYSWIPKEIIAKFVANCPSCQRKKPGGLKNLNNLSDSQAFFQDMQADSQQSSHPGSISLHDAKMKARALGHKPYTKSNRTRQSVDHDIGMGKGVAGQKRQQKKEPKARRKSTLPPDHVSYNDAQLYHLAHPSNDPGPSNMPMMTRAYSASCGSPPPYDPFPDTAAQYYAQQTRSQSFSYAQSGAVYRDDDPNNSFAVMVEAASAQSGSSYGHSADASSTVDARMQQSQLDEYHREQRRMSMMPEQGFEQMAMPGDQYQQSDQGGIITPVPMTVNTSGVSIPRNENGALDVGAFMSKFGASPLASTEQYQPNWAYLDHSIANIESTTIGSPASSLPSGQVQCNSRVQVQGWENPKDCELSFAHPEFDMSLLDIPTTSDFAASINQPDSQIGLYDDEGMGAIDPSLRYEYEEGQMGEYGSHHFEEAFQATMGMLAGSEAGEVRQ